jgi:hypothetical protein
MQEWREEKEHFVKLRDIDRGVRIPRFSSEVVDLAKSMRFGVPNSYPCRDDKDCEDGCNCTGGKCTPSNADETVGQSPRELVNPLRKRASRVPFFMHENDTLTIGAGADREAILGWIAAMRFTALALRNSSENAPYTKSKFTLMWRTNMGNWWNRAWGSDPPSTELAIALGLYICRWGDDYVTGFNEKVDPHTGWDDEDGIPSCGQWVVDILIRSDDWLIIPEDKAYGYVKKLDDFPSGPPGRTQNYGVRVEFRGMNKLRHVVYDKNVEGGAWVQPTKENGDIVGGLSLTFQEILIENLEIVRMGMFFGDFSDNRASFSESSHSFLATGRPNTGTNIGETPCQTMGCQKSYVNIQGDSINARDSIQRGLNPVKIKTDPEIMRQRGRFARLMRAKDIAHFLFGGNDDTNCVNYLSPKDVAADATPQLIPPAA